MSRTVDPPDLTASVATGAPADTEPRRPPDDWVPVEQRFLGLDRRTIWPALGVLLLALFFTQALPAFDGAVDYDDPIEAGEVIDMGSGITFVPPVGWNLEAGVRVGGTGRNPAPPESDALLVNGGVAIRALVGPFKGTPAELMDQLDSNALTQYPDSYTISTPAKTVTTASGEVGVTEGFTGPAGDGITTVFVFGPSGFKVTASGTPAELARNRDAIDGVIDSIRFDPEAAE